MKTRKGRTIAISVGVVVAVLILVVAICFKREFRAWYLLATEFQRLPDKSAGYVEYKHPETGTVFVYLPRGSVLLEPDPQNRFADARLTHVDPFLISKYEVKQETAQALASDWAERRVGFGRPREAQWQFACKVNRPARDPETGQVPELLWSDHIMESWRYCVFNLYD